MMYKAKNNICPPYSVNIRNTVVKKDINEKKPALEEISPAFFPNHDCKQSFLACENLKVAGDIAGRQRILTTLQTCLN